MLVRIPKPLRTERAPDGVATPWLTGRGPKRMVSEDWWLQVNGKWYCVPAGYIFDGASIPWWLWWLFPPGYDPAWEASCFHDWCYSHLYREVVLRAGGLHLRRGIHPLVAVVAVSAGL